MRKLEKTTILVKFVAESRRQMCRSETEIWSPRWKPICNHICDDSPAHHVTRLKRSQNDASSMCEAVNYDCYIKYFFITD